MNIQCINKNEHYSPQGESPYTLVIVSNDDELTDDEMNRLANEIITSPVRYALAWGKSCSKWDDAIDWAQVGKYPDGIPDDKSIMTTWHEDDLLDDVIEFAKNGASFDGYEGGDVCLLVIGNSLVNKDEIVAKYG